MSRLLLVSHGPLVATGGGSARWRSLARHLPGHGWEVDVVSAGAGRSSDPFARSVQLGRSVDRRARAMRLARRLTAPLWWLLRIEAPPLSMLWVPRGTRDVRRRLRNARYDVVLATGPQMAGLVAGRLGARGSGVPLVVELRDLWAGNPAYDRGGPLLRRVERWALRGARAVVVTTEEAAASLRERHPALADRVRVVPNGFEAELLERRAPGRAMDGPVTILHSGTLVAQRPLAPLLRVLARDPYRSRCRLVLHGYLAPEIAAEVERARGCDVEVLPPSSWEDAIERIRAADVGLVTQSRGIGDATAIATKAYEYLALGKPVLCVTDGGATEALLRRLGAADLCARRTDEASIERALGRLLDGPLPVPLPPERLRAYTRTGQAAAMAGVLDEARD